MYLETRKLYLIEEILKIDNELVLNEVEAVIDKSKTYEDAMERPSFKAFAGMMSDEEADELLKVIEEGCGLSKQQ